MGLAEALKPMSLEEIQMGACLSENECYYGADTGSKLDHECNNKLDSYCSGCHKFQPNNS